MHTRIIKRFSVTIFITLFYDNGFRWVEKYECSNTEISRWRLADSRKSFPSGHAAASMFSAVFMIVN